MYENCLSQLLRVTIVLKLGLDDLLKPKPVMKPSSIKGVIEILYSFISVLEAKAGRGLPESTRLKDLSNYLGLSNIGNKTSTTR